MSTGTGNPLIFDIKHFALDDGPGIRTTVFFKGCPLSCAWCHNPESISPESEIALCFDGCIRCGLCAAACPEKAIDISVNGYIDRTACTACGECTAACPTGSMRKLGKEYSPDELTSILLRDRKFYETSGGGVTFSGGEPALHNRYLHSILAILKKNNIHTALQTCGFFDFELFEKDILPFIDLIFFDIKILDSSKHKRYTGQGNEIIIKNFKTLLNRSQMSGRFKVIPRTPLIPGINDSSAEVSALKNFYKSMNCSDYILLPYNPGWKEKREALGQVKAGGDTGLKKLFRQIKNFFTREPFRQNRGLTSKKRRINR